MVQLIMLLAILQLGYNLIFKPCYDSCQCGIFGHVTNNPKKINQSNVKILGLFNETRGKHSCGITYDSEIYHGLEKDKLFTDFIKGKTFKALANPSMFGHTRSASVGAAINEHNAHPFGFGTNKTGGYKFIGVHNGTLYNHLELAKDYGIETKVKYKSNYADVELERTKIDSEIILEILHTDRTYKVLSEYIGKAALVWTDTDAPNIMYFWSGQSRMMESYINGPEIEERPMNIWIENRNSFYFSSLPESLEAIGAPSTDVFQIEYNTVYQVTNGDFKHAEVTKVSRKQCFQTETYVSKHANYAASFNTGKQPGGSENVINVKTNEYCDYEEYRGRFVNQIIPGGTATLNKTDIEQPINIYDDKPLLDQNAYKNKIYSYKLRYWQNGHLINGIYCHIPNYGFYKLGDDHKDARETFERNKGLRFYEGEFLKDKTLLLGWIPFTTALITPIFYYFLEGAMFDTILDFDTINKNREILKDTERLSYTTRHPIIDLKYNKRLKDNQNIYLGGKKYTGSIHNIGFEKTYHIASGNLVKVINKTNHFPDTTTKVELPSLSTTTVSKHNPEILKAAIINIAEIEELVIKEEILDLESSKKLEEDIDKVTDNQIIEMIDKEITPCLMSFQNCREELDLLPAQNASVIAAKGLVNDMIQTINKFVN